MKQYQFYTKMAFQLAAMTIDPQSSAYDPRPLIPYLAELAIPYLYEEQDIMKAAKEANCTSICAFCSRMKRQEGSPRVFSFFHVIAFLFTHVKKHTST